MRLRLLLAVLAALSLALAACGGSDKYMVPTDSKVKPFKAPEAEDLGGEDGDDWSIEGDDDDDGAGAAEGGEGGEGAEGGEEGEEGEEGGVEGGEESD